MVIENYSPSVIYSSPPHLIDWMRQRSFRANNLTQLYSGSRILASSLAREDKQFHHHTVALPSGENQVQRLPREEIISESLYKGMMQMFKQLFRHIQLDHTFTNADNFFHAADVEKTRLYSERSKSSCPWK
jgi:hypothetical protein